MRIYIKLLFSTELNLAKFSVDYILHNHKTINPIPPDKIIKQWEED